MSRGSEIRLRVDVYKRQDTDSEDADAADTTADDSETETADKSEEADDTLSLIHI